MRTLSGKVVEEVEPTPYSRLILNGLQKRNVYQGTVSPTVKATRRRKSKQARVSRKASRGN